MSSAAKDLLVRFDRLPEKDKVAIAHEIWRRTAPIDSGPLDDAETTAAADGIFAMLDKEETDASRRPASR
jgi:hypothetical protein